jgi:hypothetical protein
MDYACEVFIYVIQVKAYTEGHDWTDKTEVQPSVKYLEWMESSGAQKGLISAGNRDIKLWKMNENTNRQISKSSSFVPIIEETNIVKTQLTVT